MNINEELPSLQPTPQMASMGKIIYRTPPPPPTQPPSVKQAPTSAPTASQPSPPQAPARNRSSINRGTINSNTNETTPRQLPLPPDPPSYKSKNQSSHSPNTTNIEATNAAARLVHKAAMTGSIQSISANKNASSPINEPNSEHNTETDPHQPSKPLRDQHIAGDVGANQDNNTGSTISNLIANTISKMEDSPQSCSYSSSSFSSRSKNILLNKTGNNNLASGAGLANSYPWVFLSGEYLVNRDESRLFLLQNSSFK
jgi:hypothetical protein